MNDRTEIANALRAAGAELDNDPNASMRDALIKIDLVANGTNHGYEFSPLFEKLADIIDPTCRIYWTDTSTSNPETGYNPDGYYACSRCGELNNSSQYAWDDFQASYYEGEPPFEYCPHCGARIIIDEPRKDNDSER